jgi:transposase
MHGMSYPIELRKRTVAFVRGGGSQEEAVRIFKVSHKTIYNWLNRADLSPTVRGPRKHKLNRANLESHVKAYPDAMLKERAANFKVRTSTVWAALQQIDVSKKNDTLF